MLKRESHGHGFPALFDSESEFLILGSFPSAASRETAFFYGHPQNRFWKLLASVFGEEMPKTTQEKADLCHKHHIALYDSIESCSILGSSDSSIKDVVPADLTPIFENARIKRILCNGKTSFRMFERYQKAPGGVGVLCLPSTSPANAAIGFEELKKAWEKAFSLV